MDPLTLRLREDTVEALDAEFQEYGFPNRAAYLRHIIENRETVVEQTETPASSPLRDRLDAHADRLDDLADRLAAVENTETAGRPDTKERVAENSEITEITKQEDTEDTGDYAAETTANTDDYRGGADDPPDPTTREFEADALREAAVAFVRENGETRKGEFVDELRDRYPVAGQNRDTWWKKTLRSLLQADDRIAYRHGRHVYVFVGEGEGEGATGE